MKWFMIWFVMGWVNVPWWMWMLSFICCGVDVILELWRAENG